MSGTAPHAAGSAHRTPKQPFWRHLLSAAPVLLLVTAITTVLSERGLLRGSENTALDVWLQLRAPQPVRDLVLVTIDDIDYRELFGRRSPLEPARVQKIVESVLRGGPSAVGVDLDTSDEAYAKMEPPPRVVWAREGIVNEHPAPPAETHGGNEGGGHEGGGHEAGGHEGGGHEGGGHGGHGGVVFQAGPVLGREGAAAKGVLGGLALMPQDPDGLIRRYRHTLAVVDESGARGEMDTLGWAVVRALPGGDARASSEHALVLNFSGDRYAFPRLSARDVIAGSASEGWAVAGPLKNKVVLIGGTYRAARDEYITPVGPMPGVQLVAQAVESELHGGGIRPLEHSLMLLLELATGVLLVWINFRFHLGTALALSLFAMPLLALSASLLVFSSLAFWFNFVPTLVGVWIHELIDHGREYRQMHEALHATHE